MILILLAQSLPLRPGKPAQAESPRAGTRRNKQSLLLNKGSASITKHFFQKENIIDIAEAPPGRDSAFLRY